MRAFLPVVSKGRLDLLLLLIRVVENTSIETLRAKLDLAALLNCWQNTVMGSCENLVN